MQRLMTFPGVWSCPQPDPRGLESPRLCREHRVSLQAPSPFPKLRVWRRAALQGSHSSGVKDAHPWVVLLGQDRSSAGASRTCSALGGLSLAPLQGGSSEQCRCPWQFGECLASSDIQELGNGLEVSRDPLSGRCLGHLPWRFMVTWSLCPCHAGIFHAWSCSPSLPAEL